MQFKFEKLEVFHHSLDLATDVHFMTRTWPKEEMFSLTSQIKRAGDSVTLNIVEGSTGGTNPEFRQFLKYANRSALEVVAALILAKRRKYINQEQFDKIYFFVHKLSAKIKALRRSLNK